MKAFDPSRVVCLGFGPWFPILLSELAGLSPLPKWVDARRCGCPIYERAFKPRSGTSPPHSKGFLWSNPSLTPFKGFLPSCLGHAQWLLIRSLGDSFVGPGAVAIVASHALELPIVCCYPAIVFSE